MARNPEFDRRAFVGGSAATLLAAGVGPAAAQHAGMEQTGAGRSNVAVLLYDHPILFDYGPSEEIFRVAGMYSHFNVYSVAQTKDPIPNRFFPKLLIPDHDFASAPRPEVVVIGGGEWSAVADRAAKGDRRIFDWLAACLNQGATILGVCTGTYILAYSGLLDGRTATSLPAEIARFRTAAPKTTVREDMPFVDDGNIVTASGSFTGIDAALHLVRRMKGEAAARWTANTYMDYRDWDPAFMGRP